MSTEKDMSLQRYWEHIKTAATLHDIKHADEAVVDKDKLLQKVITDAYNAGCLYTRSTLLPLIAHSERIERIERVERPIRTAQDVKGWVCCLCGDSVSPYVQKCDCTQPTQKRDYDTST